MPCYRTFLGDVEILLRKIGFEHAGHPIVLFGNCWGAKAAATMSSSAYKGNDGPLPVELSGVVLTCPAIATKVDLNLEEKMKIAYNSWRGCGSTTQWPIPLTAEMLTNNPVYLEFIKNDPLRLTEATSQFFMETYKLGGLAKKAARKITLPLLVIQAGNDKIVDNFLVNRWYSRCASQEKELRLFPDSEHSIDFDAIWFKEYAHLLGQWLLARTLLVAK
jgi:alpha-beta hydrolase superfamily lysophospholipase